MSNLTMLEQANYIYTHREAMDRQALVDGAVALGEWHIFSATAISKITGLPKALTHDIVQKEDKRGGRFNPETLEAAIDLIHMRNRGEMDLFKAREVLQGTSSYFASKLTGIPRSTLVRWAALADSLMDVAA